MTGDATADDTGLCRPMTGETAVDTGPTAARQAGALADLLVADFSRVLAGPLATMNLGDLGATIIKVEAPGHGDDTRTWGPPWADDVSTYYLAVNRNKHSVVLDLRDVADRDRASALMAQADVVVENFLPGTMADFGLDYESAAAVNPGLIWCSITGFGSTGEAASRPGYDFLLQALGGLMSVTGTDGPAKVGVAAIDVVAGLYATSAILAALHARTVGGAGQRVEISLMDSALALLVNQASAYLNTGKAPTASGNHHPSIAPYELFDAEDEAIAIAVGSEATWKRLCEVLDVPRLATDVRFATNAVRVANREALHDLLAVRFATATGAAWARRLTGAGVPAGVVNDIGAAFDLAVQLGLEPTVTTPTAGGHVVTVRSPMRLDATPPSVRRAPPTLDADGTAMRDLLDVGGDALRRAVVSQRP